MIVFYFEMGASDVMYRTARCDRGHKGCIGHAARSITDRVDDLRPGVLKKYGEYKPPMNCAAGVAIREGTAVVREIPCPFKASRNMGIKMVPEEGVEPTRPCDQRILSPPRLPFRHSGVP